MLRASAIALTLLVHVEILLFWGSASLSKLTGQFFFWGGVDVFFCVSGFVITRGLIESSQRGGPWSTRAAGFWIRRFWRLTPAALGWLLLVLLASSLANPAGYLKTPLGNLYDLIYSSIYLGNYHFWKCYSDPSHLCGINQVYWSLSLEEQSYIVLPCLVFVLSRRWLLAVLAAIIVAQFALDRPMLSLWWFLRTDALAAGAMIAVIRDRWSIGPGPWLGPWRASLLLLALLASIGLIGAHMREARLQVGMMALSSALLVWTATSGRDLFLGRGRGRAKRLALYLGQRSYSLYLAHVPIYYFARQVAEWTSWDATQGAFSVAAYIFVALAMVFLSAEASYRWIEAPLRGRGRRIASAWEATHGSSRS